MKSVDNLGFLDDHTSILSEVNLFYDSNVKLFESDSLSSLTEKNVKIEKGE